jgi:D-alanyl-D-alanine carboxypeptidase/D-alanyl-D-alanine-endopeptidase (penicillin-binding protein 4)
MLSAGGLAVADATGTLPARHAAPSSPAGGPTSAAQPPRAVTPPVLRAPGARPGTPTAAGVARTLAPVLSGMALGAGVGAAVVDAESGAVLLDRGARVARTPASVAKLVTGAAALHALGAHHRLTTRVVRGARPDEIVLVGGGDPTLTAGASAGGYPQRARLGALVARAATTLKRDGVTSVHLRVDDSLFTGPSVAPSWPRTYVTSGVVAPVSALAVDAGRRTATGDARVADPALDAGARFAALLRRAGIPVSTSVTRGRASDAAPLVAAVAAPPMSALVERMLVESDNDLAEALWRHAAAARGEPPTFAGGGVAALGVLAELGVPTPGAVLLDGSGLARGSRLAPSTLALLLRAAASPDRPGLRPLLAGLPVAGLTGTLGDRFAGTSAVAAGRVRAKTGTLTGVTALAGTAPTGGRLLVFVVLADRVPPGGTAAARRRVDRVATALATCGCA